MPARTDHDRRDAQSAARATVSMQMGPYIRRMVERAYAIIEKEASENDGADPVDWVAVGQDAAYRALTEQGVRIPDRALAAVRAAIEAGPDPESDETNP